jgi:RNA polymerase sigma factor (sigma-70 family)
MTELVSLGGPQVRGDDIVRDRPLGGSHGDGGCPRRLDEIQRELQPVIDHEIDRMRFIGQAVDRAQRVRAQHGRGDARAHGACGQFTAGEHALLAAWDTGHRRLAPEPALVQRLIDAWSSTGASARSAGDLDDLERCDLEAGVGDELGDELAGDPDLEEALLRAHTCFDDDADDASAFQAIARDYEDYLVRIARRLCGSQDAARDLTQEALMRGWTSYRQFKPGTNVRSWLATILTRAFLDQLKHAKVVRKAEPELQTLDVVESDAEPPRIADAALWAAVEKLEPELRDVVERAYLRQMRYREIATELKVPIGTIGTRLKRARDRLRTLLTAPGGDPRASAALRSRRGTGAVRG